VDSAGLINYLEPTSGRQAIMVSCPAQRSVSSLDVSVATPQHDAVAKPGLPAWDYEAGARAVEITTFPGLKSKNATDS
jgi:hypothetical protein